MEQAEATASTETEERFFPSKRNPLQRSRMSLWIGFAGAIVITAISPRAGARAPLFFMFIVLLAVMLPVEYLFRRQIKKGQPQVTLTSEEIISPVFASKEKRYCWRDIEQVSVQTTKGNFYLSLQLKPSASVPSKRSFFARRNPSNPTLPLSAFDTADRERLLDTIHRHLAAASDSAPEHVKLVNQFAVEREFRDKLKALAPTPWVTYALIAANALAWLLTLHFGGGIARTPSSILFALGGNAASEVQRGEWWRLLTATFLHAGLLHITANMLGLYAVGSAVERIYGRFSYLLIYFGAGLLGSALSLHFSAQHVVSVGASGAVFGVAGAMLVAVSQKRSLVPETLSKRLIGQLGFFILYSLVQGFTKHGIDNAAHVGGLLGGCMLALVLPVRLDTERYRVRFPRRIMASLAATSLAVVSLAAFAPRATDDQRKLFASDELMAHGFKDFGDVIKAVQSDQLALHAGKLSALEVAERERTIHAQALRHVADELKGVTLRPGDPREVLLRDMTRGAELMVEAMTMDTVMDTQSRQPRPSDPARMASLQAEIGDLSKRIKQESDELKRRSNKG